VIGTAARILLPVIGQEEAMRSTFTTCLTAALFCTVLAACAPIDPSARRSTTTVRTDPRPPEDTNLIMPPVPASESASIP
jgi:hypothetical protein